VIDLFELAERSGIEIRWEDLGERHGEYLRGVITLNPHRPDKVQRIVLAHELGHAWHSHQPTSDPRRKARQEREADEHAAMLLVQPWQHRHAELMYGPSVGAVAAELGVPARFVERLRDVVKRGGCSRQCRRSA